MRNPKSPQEKKRLSLERDRRNDYGENDKSSRKNIPRTKALIIRRERHAQNQAVHTVKSAGSENAVLSAELKATTEHRRWWFKLADEPLRKVIAAKRERRKRSHRRRVKGSPD